MHVVRLDCPICDTSVNGVYVLPELARLNSEDQEFVAAFVLSGGSLKEMAKRYRVSYPTVRNRLDDLIARLREVREVIADAETPTAETEPAIAGKGAERVGEDAEEGD